MNKIIIIILILLFLASVASAAQEHPFLIVKESDFPDLQEKQNQIPYSIWKATALKEVKKSYPSSGTVRAKGESIRDIAGSVALLYIIDPTNRTYYKNRYIYAVNSYGNFINTPKNKGSNTDCVITGSAMFEMTLAIDVLYNGLTPSQRTYAESKIPGVVPFLNNCGWRVNTYAAKGTWSIYKGQDPKPYIDAFMKDIYASTADSGVFVDGGHYAVARFNNPIKETKSMFLDVIEHTGNGKPFSDPKIVALHEWMYGYTMTPNQKNQFIFGDAISYTPLTEGGAAPYRAYKFSPLASGYAAGMVTDYTTTTSGFLHYVTGKAFPKKITPVSKIYEDGAWLLEGENANEKSLGGAIVNLRTDNFHAHRETNAIHLSAYGETIIRNMGAAYSWMSPIKVSTATRTTVAKNSNVVLIDDVNHATKTGLGVTGFTNVNLDYASGDSGGALPNGKHIRNLVFVKPQGGNNGYFVLFDEVTSATGKIANVILHPNTDISPVIITNKDYTWKINKNLAFPNSNAYITAYLATPPTNVKIEQGIMATDMNYNFYSKYMTSNYPLIAGKKNIVTVLYPSDTTHSKATMTRISGSGFTGAQINNDIAIESDGFASVVYNGMNFRGTALWQRSSSEYFVKGSYYQSGDISFSANKEVVIYMKDDNGSITSQGADVTFNYPTLTTVKIDGIDASILNSGEGYTTVSIPRGTHNVQFEFNNGVPEEIIEEIYEFFGNFFTWIQE